MKKRYITIYDKNGNALLVDAAIKQQFVGRGYYTTDPKAKKETT